MLSRPLEVSDRKICYSHKAMCDIQPVFIDLLITGLVMYTTFLDRPGSFRKGLAVKKIASAFKPFWFYLFRRKFPTFVVLSAFPSLVLGYSV